MNSIDVTRGNDIKASEYNKLRLDGMQIGILTLYSGSPAPSGWFLCDGSGKDTTTYADLFAVIGYTFGGAGATFNIPNLDDKFPIGRSGTKALGTTGGGSVTLVTANLPVHSHSISSDGGHSHTGLVGNSSGGSTQKAHRYISGDLGSSFSFDLNFNSTHNHGGSTVATGSGTSFNITPSYLALNYIIKY